MPGIMNFEPSTSLEMAVGEALGAASVCWENPGGAGVFESERAARIVEELVAHIRSMSVDEVFGPI